MEPDPRRRCGARRAACGDARLPRRTCRSGTRRRPPSPGFRLRGAAASWASPRRRMRDSVRRDRRTAGHARPARPAPARGRLRPEHARDSRGVVWIDFEDAVAPDPWISPRCSGRGPMARSGRSSASATGRIALRQVQVDVWTARCMTRERPTAGERGAAPGTDHPRGGGGVVVGDPLALLGEDADEVLGPGDPPDEARTRTCWVRRRRPDRPATPLRRCRRRPAGARPG